MLAQRHNQKALEEDSDLTTLGESIPPGRDIRCIISVAMLSEGWDATTVTHTVGLRPFGSQLLWEQVVGRTLQRTAYTPRDNGLLAEETAQVFGVSFELIPFKTNSCAVWVKNDHLGSQIPYQLSNKRYVYLPDFVARLTTGVHLLLEIKEQLGDAGVKQAGARRWVDAVNRDGRWGRWTYAMLKHPADLYPLLDQLEQRDPVTMD